MRPGPSEETPRPHPTQAFHMSDVFFLALGLAVFALMALYARLATRA